MKIGLEIEFFIPERPEEIEKGRLYIDDEGKDYIEYRMRGIGYFSPTPVIFATALDSEEKYTLINCAFKQSIGSSCRYVINELYKGDHITKVMENNCVEVEASITGLTNWLNHPRIIQELSFSGGESNILVKDEFRIPFSISKNIKLELIEYCRYNFDMKETVLRNKSSIKFVCEESISRLELHKNVLAFLGFLSVFTNSPARLISESFSFKNGQSIEHLSVRELKGQTEYDNEALLRFDKIETNLQTALDIFFKERDKFTRVLDLFIESVKNRTAEVSFLNITTAFEVFHKSFYEKNNELTREELFKELKEAGLISRDTKKWDQIIRYFHLMKLTEHIGFFKQNFLDPKKTVALVRASRNYYTHYSATREEIWTPNRLLFANKTLRQLLKGVILVYLQIPSDLINRLLNNRAAAFYHDYETNEYSLLFTNKDAAKTDIFSE